MDDFAAGYSSLAYLRSFPFDKIKVDRSFVRDVTERSDAQTIIRAVTGLAQSFKISTVIEGIATEEQLKMAKAEGCNEAQGFRFSKAIREREVANVLVERRRVADAA